MELRNLGEAKTKTWRNEHSTIFPDEVQELLKMESGFLGSTSHSETFYKLKDGSVLRHRELGRENDAFALPTGYEITLFYREA